MKIAISIFIGLIIGGIIGMLVQRELDRPMPWDDGLVQINCPNGKGRDTVETTIEMVMISDLDKSPIRLKTLYDPARSITQNIAREDVMVNYADYPLGCFIRGLKYNEIKPRGFMRIAIR